MRVSSIYLSLFLTSWSSFILFFSSCKFFIRLLLFNSLCKILEKFIDTILSLSVNNEMFNILLLRIFLSITLFNHFFLLICFVSNNGDLYRRIFILFHSLHKLIDFIKWLFICGVIHDNCTLHSYLKDRIIFIFHFFRGIINI